MKIYTHPLSPNARKVQLLVSHLGLDVETEIVDLLNGAQHQPEFRELNPNGKIPLLVDGDFALWESNAILTYLAASNPEAKLLGEDVRDRASIERWLFWQVAHFGKTIATLAFERSLKKFLGLGEPDEGVVTAALKTLESEARVLDFQLDGQDFVCGDLSVADFALYPCVEQRHAAGVDFAEYPNVLAWVERVQQIDGFVPPTRPGA